MNKLLVSAYYPNGKKYYRLICHLEKQNTSFDYQHILEFLHSRAVISDNVEFVVVQCVGDPNFSNIYKVMDESIYLKDVGDEVYVKVDKPENLKKQLDNTTRAKALHWWSMLDKFARREVWMKWMIDNNELDWSYEMFKNSQTQIDLAYTQQAL